MGMSEKTKAELLDEAQEAGLDVSDSDTKAEIEAALEQHRGPSGVGPHENEDGSIDTPAPSGTPIKGVAPLEYDEVPEALR